MRKLFLLIPVLAFALMANAAIPELTKSAPLTLTAASEGFSQSTNAKALEDGEWINWSGGTIQDGFAKWRVNIADPGVYSVTLDMKSTNTYEFRVCALNPLTNDTIAKCFTEHQDRGDYSFDNKNFEPSNDDKGRLSRAIFYMGVMYYKSENSSYEPLTIE